MKVKLYRTKDLGEASALSANGFKLLQLDRESNFYWFVFEDQENQIEQMATKYWSGDLVVNAKKYSDSIRTLKDRIHANR